jgi:S-DNA-T family DNA segregation ATPase FtsK/SpoIIIE
VKLHLRVALPNGADTEVLIDADEAASVGDLTSQLNRILGRTQDDGLWIEGSRLSDQARLSETALRQGVVIALEESTQATPQAQAVGWQLHFVSGPDAGTIISLPVGSHEMGRMVGAYSASDKAMSRRHAVLEVGSSSATICDLGSANGTTVDGASAPVQGQGDPLRVSPGQIIAMGDSLLTISEAIPADAPVSPSPDGTLQYTRPPRLRPHSLKKSIVIPKSPVARKNRRIPLAAVLAPLGFGLVMALVEQPIFLLFALASPVMMIGNIIGDRRGNAKDHREAQKTYEDKLATATKQLEEALVLETSQRRAEFPDPATSYLIATLPGKRIWERRRTDPDFLSLRLGSADLPSQVEVEAGRGSDESESIETGPRTLYSVPAVIDLRECGVLGITGPPDIVDAEVRWWCSQLALMHPPRDLSMTLLTSNKRSTWSWFRWLPHAGPQDPDGAVASIGNDPDSVGRRVAELGALVRARREATAESRSDRSMFPAHVVVLDESRQMKTIQGLSQVLKDGPDVGVFAICLAEEDRFLPEECHAVVSIDSKSPAYLTARMSGHGEVRMILADQVSERYTDALARSLASLRDASKDEGEVPLPDSARLLDVLGIEPPTVDAVRTQWMLGTRTTKASLGVGSDGVFSLDLRTDGPHALVAGTTGAGKSELLQSLIASLAFVNRPDALNFVLVDYKGGSAFKDCVKLPHSVGMVTDLDTHLVERAIISLSAELKRREHMLATAGDGAKDIEDYLELLDRGVVTEPMPRLVLVIDEFASMARELPDFVTGLVNIAQRGRSLGIHLILATQRPSGVVSPEIRANTNLRISLRVTDTADSLDVIDAPDAARISKSTPGRGYARLGHGALAPFQAGRIGGRRPGVVPEHIPPPFVAELGWGQIGYPPPAPTSTSREAAVESTDLGELVSAICQAATDEGFTEQRRPWLGALPEKLLLDDLLPISQIDASQQIVFGLEDLPALQAQRPATFDLRGGHLLVIGSPRSGRSQFLRTIAGAAAKSFSPNDLHIYGLDCGNGALVPLTSLPHCGAVVSRSQGERAQRLLGRMAKEIARRQNLLSGLGVADISEQRRSAAPGERLPHIILLLDRWEGFISAFAELDGGQPLETMLNILREGGSVGIHAIVAGDRSLASGRVGSLCDNKLALRLADKGDYTYVGLNPRQLPDEILPGRGISVENVTEVQIALLADDESGQAQAAALSSIGEDAKAQSADTWTIRPFRVDDLPAHVSFQEAWEMESHDEAGLFALAGIGGDELAARGPNLLANPTFVVAGPGRSGRSTALMSIAQSLLLQKSELIIAAARVSPLRSLQGTPGVRSVISDSKTTVEEWTELLGIESDQRLVVLFDDGEDFRESPAGELFRQIMQGSSSLATGLVIGGTIGAVCSGLSGWQVDAKKARQGLLLSPQNNNEGDLIGARLSRSAVTGTVQPGRGLLHLGDGQVMVVAVPIA